jgi:EAL domain-containing protein (putative c-di-GMP-specific phosphodiesterase class I)
MDTQCVLCAFQNDCSDGNLFVYATTPILRDIVVSHLRNLGVQYQLRSEIFVFKGDQKSLAIKGLRSRLSEAERADIRVSAQAGAAFLAASTLDTYGNNEDTAWFEDALQNDKFTTFFQPIVDITVQAVFAHECLIRLLSDRVYNGGEIIDAAIARGRIHLFDSYARRLSIRNASKQFVAGTKVFINFAPSSIYDPVFCMASTLEEMQKTSLRPSDIVFEVVESDQIRDVKHLQKICDYYRNAGFGFALDDVGTGSSSMQMMCDLRPNYVKLDKSLVSKISDPMYLAAVQKLTELAFQFGLNVIAEGVELAATIEILRKIGIHLMQGYYFGKPAARMSSMQEDLLRIQNQLGSSIQPQVLPIAKLVG